MESTNKTEYLNVNVPAFIKLGKFGNVSLDLIDTLTDIKEQYEIFEDMDTIADRYSNFKLKPIRKFLDALLGGVSKKSITETTALANLINHCFDRYAREVYTANGVTGTRAKIVSLPFQKYHKSYVNDIKKYKMALSHFRSFETFFKKVKEDDLLDQSEIAEIREYFEKLEYEIVEFHTHCLKVAGLEESSVDSSVLIDDIIRNELFSYIELIDDAYFGNCNYQDKMKLLLTDFYPVLDWVCRQKRPVYLFEIQVRIFELIINQTKRSILNRIV